MEQWRPVVGYEGLYDVSDHGRVRSLDRIVAHSTPGRTRLAPGKVIAGCRSRKGYRMVELCRDGVRTMRKVAVIELETFIGPRPSPDHDACHDNGDSTDDALTNLRWDTRAANITDTVTHGTHRQSRKQRCPRKHRLAEPNLVLAELRRGGRSCWACQYARDYVRSHPGVNVDDIADAKYAEIMAAVPLSQR